MELTQEQKEIITKVFCKFVDAIKEIFEKLKELAIKVSFNFNTYVMSMQPKKRYKFLKSVGIKNYIPFFRRTGVIRCRNNC